MSITTTHITLLQRLADGQQAAWRDFHDRYSELILGFCRARGVHGADADDVLQDVLLGLAKAMPGFQYDPAKGRFRGYLRTATLHAILRRSRQNHAGPALEAIEPPGDGADAATDQQWEVQWRRYHLRRALRSMASEVSDRDMEVFDRYAVLSEDPGSIAQDLGLSVDAVYQIKSRLTRRLATIIQQQIDDEG
jgi:RNA polymerase sigma-70 factor (ECF subfamily)